MTFEDFCKLLNEQGMYRVSQDYDDDENVKFFKEEFYCLYKNTYPMEMTRCTCEKGSLSKKALIKAAATDFLVKRGLESLL